ncbi:copper chaperone PCu(A)C [Colwellia piezophila]|uniref:copper chaperone PCu(A)C n=1 Tax=Colwellia piezophila TaxID=211668 RepID=UPI00036BD3D5|nr:copper chaperone PCu(A)C [Colwellia piezophila]
MKNNYFSIALLFIILIVSISKNVYASNVISVTDGYIRASIPGSDVTAAYMTINNAGDIAMTLEKVIGTLSDRIEIHEHSMTHGMMTMRQVDNVTIDAKSKVVLQPSGLHLMIFSLKQKITEKELVTITLYFSNNTKINIQLPVYR